MNIMNINIIMLMAAIADFSDAISRWVLIGRYTMLTTNSALLPMQTSF